jgi:HAMP domain-containing protein
MPKLLVVLAAAGLFVNMCVGGFWRMSFFNHARAPLARNVSHYAHSLAAEIGSPPDTAKARALAARYALGIRYAGPGGSWESGPDGAPPAPAELEKNLREVEGEPGVRMGWAKHRFVIEVPADGARFTFMAGFGPFPAGHVGYLAVLILLLSLCLTAAFLAIRRLLAPLKVLTKAVEHIRRGEFGYRIPACGHDELGELARSFNGMSGELEEMIRAREQLLLDVSHELRSPITRIKLALEMSPESAANDSIRDDLREMEAMIAELLEKARLDSANGKLQLEDVDLSTLAAEAAAPAGGRSDRLPGRRGAGDPRRLGARAQGVGQRTGQCGEVFARSRSARGNTHRSRNRRDHGTHRGSWRGHPGGGTAQDLRAFLPRGSLPLARDGRLWAGIKPLQTHHGGPWRKHRHRQPRRRRHRGGPHLPAPGTFPHDPIASPAGLIPQDAEAAQKSQAREGCSGGSHPLQSRRVPSGGDRVIRHGPVGRRK